MDDKPDLIPPALSVPPATASSATPAIVVAHLEFKAAMLLLALVLLVGAAIAYLSYARGAFEQTQKLVLVADDSEGVVVGMNLTFAGFPIGRVHGIELAPDGNARIIVDVPVKDAHWLRTSSVFTLVRGVVGNTNIRAFSGVMTDPALPDGAVRKVLLGDATADVPRLMAEARQLLQNLNSITAEGSALNSTLGSAQTFTGKLNGPGGTLAALLGGQAEAKKVQLALDRTNSLLSRVDTLAAKTDAQVFGEQGLVRDAKGTVEQLTAILRDARASLKQVDAVLDEAKTVAANARVASTDLGALRAEVESNLRRVDHLIADINRKWPFARDTELKLP